MRQAPKAPGTRDEGVRWRLLSLPLMGAAEGGSECLALSNDFRVRLRGPERVGFNV